jgi:glycosyltransferase involved in cell wall biosynthesis
LFLIGRLAMSTRPLVSIILPTYNGAQFLEESILSCIAQVYQNWELIVIDDCSTDRTPEIIAKYITRDGRIRSFRNETNRKLPGSLNVGFSLARGAYLTWTSDDNCYRPEALEQMVKFLESKPGVGMVYCDYTEIDDNGLETKRIRVGEPTELAFINCVGACFLYVRKVYESLGDYDEELFLAEDYDYWLRISQRYKVQAFHKDLYRYRRHGESLSNKNIDRLNNVVERVLKQNLPKMIWLDSPDRAKGYMRLLNIAEANKDLKSSIVYLFKAVATSPGYVIREEHSRINGLMCDNIRLYNLIFKTLKKIAPGAIKKLKDLVKR